MPDAGRPGSANTTRCADPVSPGSPVCAKFRGCAKMCHDGRSGITCAQTGPARQEKQARQASDTVAEAISLGYLWLGTYRERRSADDVQDLNTRSAGVRMGASAMAYAMARVDCD
jgi:hypothetical protein